jgi:hypothetical protein
MEQQQAKINMEMVLQEYQGRLGNLSNENVVMSAYIKQLEKQVEELENANKSLNEQLITKEYKTKK